MLNRRQLLATGIGGAAALASLHSKAFAAAGDQPLRVGLIGCGWYGKTDLFHLMQVAPVEVVGLADVDSKMVADAAELVSTRQSSGKTPPTFAAYQELLNKEKPEVCLIATPDHWHCLPMVAACKAGADVYVQKPISTDIVEGQSMVAAAKKYGSSVQVGLQRRSTHHLQEARKRFIDSGVMGKIAYVDIHSYYGSGRGVEPVVEVPGHLDWETYVGPASWVDYRAGIHPRAWRDRMEFGNGQIGDLCVHFLDLVRMMLKLEWPEKISATGGPMLRDPKSWNNTPDTQTAVFEYPEVQVVWNQRNWGENPDPKYPWGATIYGEKGTLKLSVTSYDFIPRGDGKREHGEFLDERDKYPADLKHKATELFAAPATRTHMRDFVSARREKRKPVAHITEGHISSGTCILANLSMKLGRSLRWDAANERVIGDEEANRQLQRTYREGWQHPTSESV